MCLGVEEPWYMPSAVSQVLPLYVGPQLRLCSELQGTVSSLGSWRLLGLLPPHLPVVDLGVWDAKLVSDLWTEAYAGGCSS